MSGSPVNLQHGKFYHIYNRGINSCNLFSEADNYGYFMHLYDKHISGLADTFAWVLMPNHFHLLPESGNILKFWLQIRDQT